MSLLAHPEKRRPSPPPPRADLTRVVLLGMGAWAVALVVTLILFARDSASLLAVLTCAAGFLLGGPGLLWARRHRNDRSG